MTDTDPAPDDSLGRSIAERQRPLRSRRSSMAGEAGRHASPGMLARRSSSFGLSAGLSLMARRELGMVIPDPAVDGLPVAPPAEWDESMLPSERVRTGNATLDHIIATQSGGRRPTAAPRRGLRSATTRRNTPVGLNTAPGASARRLGPQSTPPSLNPEVRRAVSGDASESRPRAPRSGPRAAGPGGGRSPSSRTGRHARGRVERSAPWHNHSAQQASGASTPLTRRVSGPVAMSGRSVPAAVLGLRSAVGADPEVGPSAVASGPGPLPIPIAQLVADIADDIVGQGVGQRVGQDMAPFGLARAASPLAPSVRAPGSSAPAHAVGAAQVSAARMTERHQATGPATASSRTNPSAAVSAQQAGAAPAALNRAFARGATQGDDPSVTPATSPAIGLADPHAPARSAHANAAAMTAVDTTAPLRAAPGAAEPAMAAMLRAAPPSISLSSRPRRSFTAGAHRGTSSLNAPHRPSARPQVPGARTDDMPLRGSAGRPAVADASSRSPFGSPSAPWAGTAGLTVGPAGVAVVAAPDTHGFTGAPAQPPIRGLGSVASIVSPPSAPRSDLIRRQDRPAAHRARSSTGLSSHAPTAAAAKGQDRADHARRVMRSLPDLATPMARAPIPVVAGMAMAGAGSVSAGASAALAGTAGAGFGAGRSPAPFGTSTTVADASARAMQSAPGALGSASSGGFGVAPPPSAETLPFTPSPTLTPSARLSSLVGPPTTGSLTTATRAAGAGASVGAPGAAGSSDAASARGTRAASGMAGVTGMPPLPGAVSPHAAPGARPVAGARPAPAGRAIPGTPTGTDAIAPPPVMPVDPGERFEQVLEEHAGPSLSRLPQRFEPIARAILPRPEQVRISTGAGSREALSSVGKVAATSGNVVHLARDLDDSPQSVDILAHELTHVANPSPLVRFFDDDRDSKEERLANEMGSVMAKAPVGTPPASPPPPPGGDGAKDGGAGGDAGSSWGPGNMPPLPPTPPSVGGGSGAGEQSAPPPAGAPGGILAPWANQDQNGADGDGTTGAGTGAATLDVDRLLDALESRIIRELERRGRRWPRPM